MSSVIEATQTAVLSKRATCSGFIREEQPEQLGPLHFQQMSGRFGQEVGRTPGIPRRPPRSRGPCGALNALHKLMRLGDLPQSVTYDIFKSSARLLSTKTLSQTINRGPRNPISSIPVRRGHVNNLHACRVQLNSKVRLVYCRRCSVQEPRYSSTNRTSTTDELPCLRVK
ncbi:hypothetical protein EYF80_016736 [Liparis tanakae]|uniref:Uncharacterized protein n=1 Tax=Liparis tanakae TaxID=230148 RepID=A0A4Z2I4R8_9TELE|nr:hypothetical protein EYF80_016736 [Liparis tanakae]